MKAHRGSAKLIENRKQSVPVGWREERQRKSRYHRLTLRTISRTSFAGKDAAKQGKLSVRVEFKVKHRHQSVTYEWLMGVSHGLLLGSRRNGAIGCRKAWNLKRAREGVSKNYYQPTDILHCIASVVAVSAVQSGISWRIDVALASEKKSRGCLNWCGRLFKTKAAWHRGRMLIWHLHRKTNVSAVTLGIFIRFSCHVDIRLVHNRYTLPTVRVHDSF